MFSGQCLHFRSAPPYLECTACLSAIALRQQQPLGSPHCQPLLPSPDPDAEMSSPTHANSSIDHYGLLQPPSPRDNPIEGTPPSDDLPFRDIEPVDYMSYGETLQWLYDTAGAPAAKGEGPYSDGYYAAYPRTPPPPDPEQPTC